MSTDLPRIDQARGLNAYENRAILQDFSKRLKGFEPSTFCMASSSHETGHHKERLQTR
jgi:hypothetical protein